MRRIAEPVRIQNCADFRSASAKLDLVESRVISHLQDVLEQIDLEQPEHHQDLGPS